MHRKRPRHDALTQIMQNFDAAKMDALLLLSDRARASGYDGQGDYMIDEDRRLTRRQDETEAHIFAGMQILTPALFDGTPDVAFSLNAIYDAAQAQNRLFGHMLDGHWMHVGTPAGRITAEAYLAAQ